jgi:hypothetical protein
MKNSSDDTFITKLMEETYQFIPDNDSCKNSVDLWNYFSKQNELTLEERKSQVSSFDLFCQKRKLTYCETQYISSLSCFRIKYQDRILDVPRNWSFFKQLYVGIKNGLDQLIHIDQSNDYDLFLQVFPQMTGLPQDIELIAICSARKLYMIFDRLEDKILLQDLKNFFQLEETPVLKAA